MAFELTLGTMLLVNESVDVPDQARQIREAGYTCVQIHFSDGQATLRDAANVRRTLDASGLDVAAVCCHLARNRSEDFLFTSPDGLQWLLEAAGVCGTQRVVMWSGSTSNDLRGEDRYNATDQALDRLEAEFERFLPAVEAAGITLCLEPFYPHVTGTPERMAQFCGRFESGCVACALDVPNFISPALYDQTNALIPSIIRAVGPHVQLLHFKDIERNAAGALTLPGPGGGILDYPVVMQELQALDRPLVGITEHLKPGELRSAYEFIRGLA